MPTGSANDVVVVGGGVIGLSIAWQAASAGLTVTVVDPTPGRGATWAAAGMLAPVGEAHFGEEGLAHLNLVAAERWPAFARSLEAVAGRPVGYRECGTVLAAVDSSDRRAIDDLLGLQRALGLAAERLSASQCRALEPLLAPGIRGGATFPQDHQVDNRMVVDALVVAGQAAGVALVHATVAAITSDGGGRATGVALDGGDTIAAGQVVLAAGCQSGQVGGLAGAAIPPVRPVKGLTLRLRAPAGGPALATTVRGVVHGRACYLVPRADGTVVVGATVEEKGFDRTVQARAVYELLADGHELVPALDEYELVDATTGLRPGSPDNAPMVGATGTAGLLVATGHYRNGILLAPITADAVVSLLVGEPLPSPFLPFGLDRFAPAGTARV